LTYSDKNWKRHVKYGGDAPDKRAPIPSGHEEIQTDEETPKKKSKNKDEMLSLGQFSYQKKKIFENFLKKILKYFHVIFRSTIFPY